VVASLWNVHKGSSQLLLDRFYEQWLQTGRRVSRWKAMQAAQLSLLRGEYSHPYHWAAFVVVGDWF
jgi:CHAT domain-containing protein